MSDIVERLRIMAPLLASAQEAADEITRLRAEVERLRAALMVWQNAYKTGRNEPLVQAYEHSTALGDTHE